MIEGRMEWRLLIAVPFLDLQTTRRGDLAASAKEVTAIQMAKIASSLQLWLRLT
jgi:hypothetical protein